MDKSYDVRWYVTEGSGGRILSGPYATDQEADSVRNRDAGEWVSGMGDAVAEQLRSEELAQGYERIATLETYVQKLEDMIYLEALKPKPVPPVQVLPWPPQISPGIVPYPYTINHT